MHPAPSVPSPPPGSSGSSAPSVPPAPTVPLAASSLEPQASLGETIPHPLEHLASAALQHLGDCSAGSSLDPTLHSELPPIANLPRVLLDQSVLTGLLLHAQTDYTSHVQGFLGGTLIDVSDEQQEASVQVFHITHFKPVTRSLTTLLSGTWEDLVAQYTLAKATWEPQGVHCFSVYRNCSRWTQPCPQDTVQLERLSKVDNTFAGFLTLIVAGEGPASAALERSCHSKGEPRWYYPAGIKVWTLADTPPKEGQPLSSFQPHTVEFAPQLHPSPAALQQTLSVTQACLQELKQLQIFTTKVPADHLPGVQARMHYSATLLAFLQQNLTALGGWLDQVFVDLAMTKHTLKLELASELTQTLASSPAVPRTLDETAPSANTPRKKLVTRSLLNKAAEISLGTQRRKLLCKTSDWKQKKLHLKLLLQMDMDKRKKLLSKKPVPPAKENKGLDRSDPKETNTPNKNEAVPASLTYSDAIRLSTSPPPLPPPPLLLTNDKKSLTGPATVDQSLADEPDLLPDVSKRYHPHVLSEPPAMLLATSVPCTKSAPPPPPMSTGSSVPNLSTGMQTLLHATLGSEAAALD